MLYNISTKKEVNKMKVYKPVFDGKWLIAVLDTDLLRRIPGTNSTVCYYKKNVGFYGPVYNTDNIFKTREAAQRWLDKKVVSQEDLFTEYTNR